MTTIDHHSDTDTDTLPTQGEHRTGARFGLLHRLGGLCLMAAPVLFVAGAVTSPPQDSGSDKDYVISLADDRFQTALSANFFHYSWVLFTFGLIAVIALVRGRRGRLFTTVTAVIGAVCSVQISGLLLLDYFVWSIVHHSDVTTAVAVEGDLGHSVGIWLITGQLAALMVPLVFFGLARARVLSWWVAPLPLVGAVLIAVPLTPVLSFALMTASWAPAYIAGFRLARGRIDTPAA